MPTLNLDEYATPATQLNEVVFGPGFGKRLNSVSHVMLRYPNRNVPHWIMARYG